MGEDVAAGVCRGWSHDPSQEGIKELEQFSGFPL